MPAGGKHPDRVIVVHDTPSFYPMDRPVSIVPSPPRVILAKARPLG
jgi:hypothetical protein